MIGSFREDQMVNICMLFLALGSLCHLKIISIESGEPNSSRDRIQNFQLNTTDKRAEQQKGREKREWGGGGGG